MAHRKHCAKRGQAELNRRGALLKFSRNSFLLRRAVFALVLAATLSAGISSAELQRVEAVGNYGIREALRSKVIPRDEAILRARWEAVSRVALELLGESSLAIESLSDEGPGEAALLESTLGKDMLPYTRSFRILKDKGEVPALFAEDPEVKTEYVVVVEVTVDVDRVKQALSQSGLLSESSGGRSGEILIVEVLGLSRYEALEETLAALRGPLGATRVSTVEFAHEKQVLAVEGPFEVEGLSRKLSAYRNARLRLEPIAIDVGGGRLRVQGHWTLPNRPAAAGTTAGKGGE